MLILAGALIGLSRLITRLADNEWAHLARAGAIASTALGAAQVAIDGIATRQINLAWTNAPAESRAVALRVSEPIEQVDAALCSTSILVFFGITYLLYGLALVTSRALSGWIGWLPFRSVPLE